MPVPPLTGIHTIIALLLADTRHAPARARYVAASARLREHRRRIADERQAAGDERRDQKQLLHWFSPWSACAPGIQPSPRQVVPGLNSITSSRTPI
jgi:hypothetical protein